MELSGKNIVYVGGFGGIGVAVCKELVQKNVAHLYILDLKENSEVLSSLRAQNTKTQVHFQPYDVTKGLTNARQVLANVINKISHFDILINGAGIINEARFEEMIQINLFGLICTTTAAVELWDKRKGGKGGRVINIASNLGLSLLKETVVYSTTKSAVITFTRALALQQPETGVSTIVICPSKTETALLLEMQPYMNITTKEEFQEKVKKAPVQTAEELAEQMLQLVPNAENGSVWLIEGAKSEQITIPEVLSLPEELL